VLSATIIAVILVTVTTGMHVAGFGIMLRSIWPLGLAPPTRVPLIVLLIQRVAWVADIRSCDGDWGMGVVLPPRTLFS
jgi:hypothetical protein